jgi:Putative peptidoglycan binding domain/D-alanyl-D-alanine carboxypeptidase
LKSSTNSLMLTVLGDPRGTYDKECRDPTNPRIAGLMKIADIGLPTRVRGLVPAVDALSRIIEDIRREKPDIYGVLNHVGMLCCRLVRGSSTAISNHSWGAAIDLTIEGKLDKRGDERTQKGLLEIHPIFNRHEFFWGASFSTQDAMHFEVSEQLMRRWADEGKFGEVPKSDVGFFNIGDRSPEVEEIQQALNLVLAMDMDVDGIFGKDTRAGVMEFQRMKGLLVDGVVGPDTMEMLRRIVG